MASIAIITARGGSKRIPQKNIKLFCGKPIIVYSIEAALKSGIFDEVMVSTDSDEIAKIALAAGAKVPFMRSEETSNDFATTADVLLEVFGRYESNGLHFEKGCCIYPTAPFVTSGKLTEGMDKLEQEKVDTVMPVTTFSFPPQRGLILQGKYLCPAYPEHIYTRSQDLETMYHDCGQFYCFKVESFLKNKSLLEGTIVPFILSELEVQDIDNLTDWEMAELKYKFFKGTI